MKKTIYMLKFTALATGLVLVTLSLWACASYGPSDAGNPATLTAATPQAVKAYDESPSIFNEAPTPEGWPALTPVDEIRVKTYPTYRAAFITADEDNASSSGLFRPLFNHIKREEIAMTAPVAMTYNDQGQQQSMAFLYRTADMGTAGSDTKDPRIKIQDMPAQTVVSIGLKGSYSHSRYERSVEKLEAWLKDNPGYEADGEPRYLGYNSPFVPGPLQYGEVQIPVVLNR